MNNAKRIADHTGIMRISFDLELPLESYPFTVHDEILGRTDDLLCLDPVRANHNPMRDLMEMLENERKQTLLCQLYQTEQM